VIDPALQTQLPGALGAPDEDIAMGQEETDPDIAFYRFAKKKRAHVCPFANVTRQNACDHSADLKRKDKVKHHLQDVITKGYDDQHPQDDPLWQTSLVAKYYLQRRPAKFEKAKVKSQTAKYNAVYYGKKKEALNEKGAEMKTKYQSGEISAAEYRKFLIGHERRMFSRSMEIEEVVKRRLAELKADGGAGGAVWRSCCAARRRRRCYTARRRSRRSC
jgi:hypothetical protein